MDTVNAIRIIRDNLRTNYPDVYPLIIPAQPARVTSSWIFADEPISSDKFPRLQIVKLDNKSVPISLDTPYTEYETLVLAIYVYSKNGFKIRVSGIDYTNSQVVEYMLDKIKTVLKAQMTVLHNAGVKMYKHTNTSPVGYNPDTQLHYGFATVSVAYFNK